MPLHVEKRNWQVTRFCCRSGNCEDCHAGFNKANRKRVVHADNVTQEYACDVAHRWSAYEAEAHEKAED